jgi:hypothetical protein
MPNRNYADDITRDIQNRSKYFDFSIGTCPVYEANPPYDIVFLSTRSWFIGDIDFEDIGDFSLDDFVDYLIQAEEDERYNLKFRTYRTYGGYRFFVTNKRVNINSEEATFLFDSFPIDPAYEMISRSMSRYRVRLSPKIRKEESSDRLIIDPVVADLVYLSQPESEYDIELATIIQIHDSFCCSKIYHPNDLLKSDSRRNSNHEETVRNDTREINF